MKILSHVSDIFALPVDEKDAVCITTNGVIRKDGRAVMGRGIARIADIKFNLAPALADGLRKYGNHAFYMGALRDAQTGRVMSVITFPTKHDWKNKSDLDLIQQSARELIGLCNQYGIQRCYLPCPGCANGGLDWETQVRPLIEPILAGDRFVIADYGLNRP